MQSVVIVHVADIHILNASSTGLMRLRMLADAIGALRVEADAALILLTGDIAFSGKREQYALVETELSGIKKRLSAEWGFVDVRIFACPGNHDCDFDLQKNAIREALLHSVATSGDGQVDIVRELAEVQSGFNVFLESLDSLNVSSSPLVSFAELEIAGRSLNIVSVNTSWSSRKSELPGSLRMPAGLLPQLQISEGVSFALLHHPLNWYDPQDGKSLSDWLDVNADIAMWGHEHREDSFKVHRRRYGSSVQHFLARPIEDKNAECGFRAIILSQDDHVEEALFRWKTNRFELDRRESSLLRRNPARRLGKIRFNGKFKSFLSDPGGAFKHPRLERSLLLQDIFIEPNFRAYATGQVDIERLDGVIPLEAFVNSIGDHDSVAVFGAEQAGKTTLAKYLVEDARHHGVTPLYFDCSKLKSANRGEVTAWIKGSISSQYEDDCIGLVDQTLPSSKLILVDNVHELPGSAHAVREILQRLGAMGKRIVYFSAQNPMVTILAASQASGEEVKLWSDAKWYELLPLNNKARGHLIRRWVSIGRDSQADADAIEAEARRIKGVLDGTFGSGLSIKYPFFMLAMLQQIDVGINAKTVIRNGSQGHIFEAMLSSALEARVHTHDISLTHDFLSAIAFQMWSVDGQVISESGLESLVFDFRRDQLVQLMHPALINELVDSKILQRNGDGVGFRYQYFYYYYLARWISKRKGTSEAEELLKGYVDKIHAESAANIVTFVAHLGHEEWVLSLLIPAAESLFAGEVECRLASQAALAHKYLGQSKSVVLHTGNAAEISDHLHEQQDQAGDKEGVNDLEDAFKYMTAVRTIQVLGQIMRSRSGSIPAVRKHEIAKLSISLARRQMTVMYSAAETAADIIIEHASELFDKEIAQGSAEARGLASRLIAAVVGGVAKGLVSRAAEVVATKEFLPLIDILEEEAKSAKDIDNELIALCARVVAEQRYPAEKVESLLYRLPDSDVLSRSALAHSVVRTFYLKPPHHAVRDSACERLGISIRPFVRKLPSRQDR